MSFKSDYSNVIGAEFENDDPERPRDPNSQETAAETQTIDHKEFEMATVSNDCVSIYSVGIRICESRVGLYEIKAWRTPPRALQQRPTAARPRRAQPDCAAANTDNNFANLLNSFASALRSCGLCSLIGKLQGRTAF